MFEERGTKMQCTSRPTDKKRKREKIAQETENKNVEDQIRRLQALKNQHKIRMFYGKVNGSRKPFKFRVSMCMSKEGC